MYLSAVKRVPVGALIEYPGNPRRGNVPAIAESLGSIGQYKPVLVHEATNHILAGNHTWKAVASLGWEEISVIYVTCDDATARKIVAADNRIADLGGYDAGDLAALLSSVDDLTGTGYSSDDLARMTAPLPEGFPVLDPDAPGPAAKLATCPSCGCEFSP